MARLCRRICVLAERGDLAEADRLRRGEFAAAVTALRDDRGADGMFAAEAARLADATLLAGTLAPLLLERLSPMPPMVAARVEPLPAAAISPSPVRTRSGPPADIADFIDEMLSLERPAPPDHPRRAS